MHRLCLIRNPNAGEGKPEIKTLRKILGNKALIRSPKNPHGDLDKVICEFLKYKPDIIISVGGDGTFQKCLNSYLRQCRKKIPHFMILKSGTINYLAKTIGLRENHEDSLKFLMRTKIKELETFELQTIKIEADGKTHYGITLVAGSFYNFFEFYGDETRGRPGFGKATEIIGKSLFSKEFRDSIIKSENSKLIIDGKKVSDARTVILVSGVKLNIIGFSPFGFFKNEKGLYVADTNLDAESILKSLHKLYIGDRIKGIDYSFDVKKILLNPAHEIKYILDGEVYKARKIKICAGPKINVVKI